MVGGHSIVFTRKIAMVETSIRKSTNLCQCFVGIVESQLYPNSICQPMPTGLYTRWEYDSETQCFTPRQNNFRSFENMVLSYFQRSRPACRIESNATTVRQRKIGSFSVDGISDHCSTVSKAMVCYYCYCSCQAAQPSVIDAKIESGKKRRQED